MNDMLARLYQIARRARVMYRLRNGLETGIRVAIVASAAIFVVMLLEGLGFLQPGAWRWMAAGGGLAVAMSMAVGTMRRIAEEAVMRRLDGDYRFDGALATSLEFLRGSRTEQLPPLALAHVRQSLERAEGLLFMRAVTVNLGAPARILGILCACIVSLAIL
jgi:hypothetical protein